MQYKSQNTVHYLYSSSRAYLSEVYYLRIFNKHHISEDYGSLLLFSLYISSK